MNQDEKDILSSFAPNQANELKIGEKAIYREGIARADVKILEKFTIDNWTTIKIEVIGNNNEWVKFGEVITLGKKEGYEYVGWILQPIVGLN